MNDILIRAIGCVILSLGSTTAWSPLSCSPWRCARLLLGDYCWLDWGRCWREAFLWRWVAIFPLEQPNTCLIDASRPSGMKLSMSRRKKGQNCVPSTGTKALVAPCYTVLLVISRPTRNDGIGP